MLTKEQILSSYMTDEHVSPIIQDYINTTPRREIDNIAPSPTSERIQKVIDALEEETKPNPILTEYM